MSLGTRCAARRARALIAVATGVVVGLSAVPAALAGPSTWTLMHPSSSPSPRTAVTAYDPLTRQTVLFGGSSIVAGNFMTTSDTWTWDGTSWTRRTPVHVPPARAFQQMAFDAASGQLLMFGGAQFGAGLADTWDWTGSDWQLLHPAVSPPSHDVAPMAYDPATGQLVMYGGVSINAQGNGAAVTDTWTWDGTTWTQRHPLTSPGAHDSGVMAFDPAIGKPVLFGGGFTAPNDSWAWDGSNWNRLALAAAPAGRSNSAMALDPVANQVILTGGQTASASFSDTWQLGTGWTRLAPATSAPLNSLGGLAGDPGSGHLMLFGGSSGVDVASNQTWVWGPFTVTARSLPVGQTAIRYSQTLQATGGKGTLSWTVEPGSLPPGVSLSRQGVLSGAATKTGTFRFTATAADASTPAQAASRSFALTINQGPIPAVYVANRGDSAINAFALGASGNATPVATLAGPLTTLDAPTGMTLDATGRLYVANANANAVDVFAAGASGNVTPVAILAGSRTSITDPSAVALDAAGNLYVADLPANAITVYAPGANGDTAPVRTITGAATQLSAPDALTVNAAGDLWVANGQSNTLTEYVPTADGNATPIAIITGAATNLDTPNGVAQDPAGRLLVADSANPSVDTFTTPVTTSGPAPVATLAGPSTQLAYPIGIDLDAAGREYVANQFGALTVYTPGAQGDSAPQATISGPSTGLSAPGAVAVLPPLYVTTHRLRRARAGRRYHWQLRALLGRSPLRWRITRGRLPAGLHLTRSGVITGHPRRARRTRITVTVSDATYPAMHARQALRLTVTAHHR